MFKSPHLTLLFCCTTPVVVVIFIRFLCITPLLFTFDLINLNGWGADAVCMGFWVGTCSSGSAERHLGLQLPPGLNWVVMDLVHE